MEVAVFERFTNVSRLAVALANQATHRLGGNIIGDVELLLGLAWRPQNNCVDVLERLGVNLSQLRARLSSQPRPQGNGTAPTKLSQSVEFKRAIEAAIALSAEAGQDYVGTEHVLLGILRFPQTAAASVLAAMGVTFEAGLRETVELSERWRTSGEV